MVGSVEVTSVDDGNVDRRAADEGWLDKALTVIWKEAIIGDGQYSPDKSCYQLAAEYRDSGKSPEQCARNFIKWQTGKSGAAGFALGLPGFAAMPITIPADLASTSYFQLRMIAVIGILFGWEPKSDQLRTVAFGCLLGTVAGETVRDVGVKASTRFGSNLINKIPGSALKKVNKALHIPRFFIKGTHVAAKTGGNAVAKITGRAGSRGIINLTKMVPLLGGIVGGGLNIVFTRQMGLFAISVLRDGPPDGAQGVAT